MSSVLQLATEHRVCGLPGAPLDSLQLGVLDDIGDGLGVLLSTHPSQVPQHVLLEVPILRELVRYVQKVRHNLSNLILMASAHKF